MSLTITDLGLIRDEIGDTTPPTDGELRQSYQDRGHWILVAVRILKRRLAAASSGGGVSQVTVPGAIGVTLSSSNLTALGQQIARLEARYEQETGVDTGDQAVATSGRLHRRTAR